jgi:hypothetical protein
LKASITAQILRLGLAELSGHFPARRWASRQLL